MIYFLKLKAINKKKDTGNLNSQGLDLKRDMYTHAKLEHSLSLLPHLEQNRKEILVRADLFVRHYHVERPLHGVVNLQGRDSLDEGGLSSLACRGGQTLVAASGRAQPNIPAWHGSYHFSQPLRTSLTS